MLTVTKCSVHAQYVALRAQTHYSSHCPGCGGEGGGGGGAAISPVCSSQVGGSLAESHGIGGSAGVCTQVSGYQGLNSELVSCYLLPSPQG